ncbi:MAG: HAD-IA family hydrolase [Acidimicrobiales bacterium]
MSDALTCVVFDVDGTLVDSERDGHRIAFNRAFDELGLPDRWDEELYGRLLEVTGGARRIDTWLRERGMEEAERSRLVPRLHERKTALFQQLVTDRAIDPRPGVRELLDDLDAACIRLAVATTGTRSWVGPLLDLLFGAGRFPVVITGDDVPARKPDPSAYLMALDELGVDPRTVLAVEDSEPGLVAAHDAGLACAVVVNDYTAGHDLTDADLLLDGFGAPQRPATVLADPHGVATDGVLSADTLRRLAAAAAGDA